MKEKLENHGFLFSPLPSKDGESEKNKDGWMEYD